MKAKGGYVFCLLREPRAVKDYTGLQIKLHTFSTSAFNGDGWLASCFGRP